VCWAVHEAAVADSSCHISVPVISTLGVLLLGGGCWPVFLLTAALTEAAQLLLLLLLLLLLVFKAAAGWLLCWSPVLLVGVTALCWSCAALQDQQHTLQLLQLLL
jgi:hypothetical protein